jgi:nicotinamidase/pyrazinamidase
LIVIDVQNDFADPTGSLYVREGEKVVPVANREIERAHTAGALIVYTMDWHPEVTPHFAKDGGVWPVHCVQDTWGAHLHPDLRLVEGHVVKTGSGGEDGYSGFTVRDPVTGEETPTDLEVYLREAGVERVVILGLATDYCVKETALDARRLGFPTSLILDGVRAVELEEGDGARALEEIRLAGGLIE